MKTKYESEQKHPYPKNYLTNTLTIKPKSNSQKFMPNIEPCLRKKLQNECRNENRGIMPLISKLISSPKDCKIYPLSPEEQKEQDKFLEENLRKG